MYVKLQSSYQIVTLPEDFLTLRKVDGDKLTFELKYQFNQEIGIKKNITSVRVEVAVESRPSLSSLPLPRALNARSIIELKKRHAALIKKHFDEAILTSITSDPTKSINNEVVALFNRGYTAEQIPHLQKTELTTVLTSDATNALSPVRAQHDLAISDQTQQQVAEELLLMGHDPSSAYKVNDLGLTLAEAHKGILQKSPSVFKNEVEKALYKYKTLPFLGSIVQKFSGEVGTVIDTDEQNSDTYTLHRAVVSKLTVDVKDELKFEFSSSKPDKLVLTLNVKDSAGVTVQQLVRTFYPREYIKYYSIPTQPPVVKLSSNSNRAYATLAIKQIDAAATRVRLYKRTYNHHELSNEPFVFVNEFELTPTQGWKYHPIEVSLGNTTIYHVVPTNDLGVIGSDYTSVVVKPKLPNSTIKRVVVTAVPQLKGVLLEISKLPSDAVSFQMVREDITLDRGTREFVETPIRVETADPNRVYTLTDLSVKQNHVYAYYCRIYRRNGSHEERLTTHYEHVALVENIVDTKVVDPTMTLTSAGYDVRFTITSTVIKTKVDQIKHLLEKQGLYEIFANDVADVREQLGKLISHNIKRVDLLTGEVEDFGTVDGDTFSDLGARKVAGVSDLRLGRKYRYIVTPLLRASETLLESYVKTATDLNTNRLYSYKPFKFLHPIVAQRGNIVTPSSIRTNYSKDPMTFGEIGAYAMFEIALDKQASIITTATREKRGSDVDVLTWVLQGPSKEVDHFQIIKEHGGSKTVVGKSTYIPETNNFVYVRRLEQTEVGLDIRYYICPVYHDYTRGSETRVANSGETP